MTSLSAAEWAVGGAAAAAELALMEPWADRAAAITVEERQGRMDKARRRLTAVGADALFIGAGPSLHYFTGLGWGMIERLVALVLPRVGAPCLICPAFEAGSLSAALSVELKALFWEEDEDPAALAASVFREAGVETLALDPALPFGMVDGLRSAAPSIDLLNAAVVVDACRAVKSASELALMRQAKAMTLEVQRRAARILAPGIKASAVRRFIDAGHRAMGASGSTFCAVQFGRSTALPHGAPVDDVLAEGDMVLIDTGCAVEGYNSDITRSYVFGEATAEQRWVWTLEQEAQQAAFDAVRPGAVCEDVDFAARRVLERAGLGPGYGLPGLPHRTGHGIGLSLHEAPYLVRGDRTGLRPGMCFSNEPMIVLPGRFGVRLEDHFFVTETGAEWFTSRSVAVDRPFD